MFFELEQQIVYVYERVLRRLLRLVICIFQGEVLIFEFIEISALFAVGCVRGGVVPRGKIHIAVDAAEHRVEILARFPAAEFALDDHRLGHLFADAHDGIETGERILKDHGDLVAADLVEPLFLDLHQILPVVDDLAALLDGVGREDAEDGARRDRLARPRFADDGERLSPVQVETDISDCLNVSGRRLERDDEIADGEFDFFVFHISCLPP